MVKITLVSGFPPLIGSCSTSISSHGIFHIKEKSMENHLLGWRQFSVQRASDNGIPQHVHHRTPRGFTLLELMIVLAIIGILAAIAIPFYNNYITRSKITEAVGALSDLRVRMEQYYQDNRFYNADGSVGDTTCGNVTQAATTNFTFACVSANSGQSYVWTATGRSSMAGFTYTVNQVNARTTTIAAPAPWSAVTQNCWILNEGGGC
jgi:type IV pilus assembly protein PilE